MTVFMHVWSKASGAGDGSSKSDAWQYPKDIDWLGEVYDAVNGGGADHVEILLHGNGDDDPNIGRYHGFNTLMVIPSSLTSDSDKTVTVRPVNNSTTIYFNSTRTVPLPHDGQDSFVDDIQSTNIKRCIDNESDIVNIDGRHWHIDPVTGEVVCGINISGYNECGVYHESTGSTYDYLRIENCGEVIQGNAEGTSDYGYRCKSDRPGIRWAGGAGTFNNCVVLNNGGDVIQSVSNSLMSNVILNECVIGCTREHPVYSGKPFNYSSHQDGIQVYSTNINKVGNEGDVNNIQINKSIVTGMTQWLIVGTYIDDVTNISCTDTIFIDAYGIGVSLHDECDGADFTRCIFYTSDTSLLLFDIESSASHTSTLTDCILYITSGNYQIDVDGSHNINSTGTVSNKSTTGHSIGVTVNGSLTFDDLPSSYGQLDFDFNTTDTAAGPNWGRTLADLVDEGTITDDVVIPEPGEGVTTTTILSTQQASNYERLNSIEYPGSSSQMFVKDQGSDEIRYGFFTIPYTSGLDAIDADNINWVQAEMKQHNTEADSFNLQLDFLYTVDISAADLNWDTPDGSASWTGYQSDGSAGVIAWPGSEDAVFTSGYLSAALITGIQAAIAAEADIHIIIRNTTTNDVSQIETSGVGGYVPRLIINHGTDAPAYYEFAPSHGYALDVVDVTISDGSGEWMTPALHGDRDVPCVTVEPVTSSSLVKAETCYTHRTFLLLVEATNGDIDVGDDLYFHTGIGYDSISETQSTPINNTVSGGVKYAIVDSLSDGVVSDGDLGAVYVQLYPAGA